MKVVVADANLVPFREQLAQHSPPGTELSVHPAFDEAVVTADLADAEVFVGSTFTRAMAAAARRLKLVHVAGAGTDGIDASALRPGVVCANTFHHGRSIAEHVAMALVALNRRTLVQDAALRQGRWVSSVYDRSLPQPATLAGQTVGFVGFGHNNTLIWQLLQAFGMRGVAVATSERTETSGLDWIGLPDKLDALLAESDAVVLSVPLRPETRGMIGARQLRAMKPTAILVNVGRGLLVDEEALYTALRDGEIGGAAIDVWYTYPGPDGQAQPSAYPFAELDNVLMTPHSSGVTTDTFANRVRDIGENITRLAEDTELARVVMRG